MIHDSAPVWGSLDRVAHRSSKVIQDLFLHASPLDTFESSPYSIHSPGT